MIISRLKRELRGMFHVVLSIKSISLLHFSFMLLKHAHTHTNGIYVNPVLTEWFLNTKGIQRVNERLELAKEVERVLVLVTTDLSFLAALREGKTQLFVVNKLFRLQRQNARDCIRKANSLGPYSQMRKSIHIYISLAGLLGSLCRALRHLLLLITTPVILTHTHSLTDWLTSPLNNSSTVLVE